MNAVTGGRGALVDVGRPGVERRGADLEQQADGEQRRCRSSSSASRRRRRCGPPSAMPPKPHRAGVAVEQRDAVEEERRGERAEQEVLQRRLLAEQPAAAGQPAEQVERQREHLERDEHREQVVGRREQQHAADREQQQREDLGLLEAGAVTPPLVLGARQRGRPGRRTRHRRRRATARRRAARRRARAAGSCPAGTASGRRRRPRPRRRSRAVPVGQRRTTSHEARATRPPSGEHAAGRACRPARAARTPRRARRRTAAPKTISIGEQRPYSSVGAVNVASASTSITVALLRRRVPAGTVGAGSVHADLAAWCASTAGLMTSSSGFGIEAERDDQRRAAARRPRPRAR